jgi:hypothetical protein
MRAPERRERKTNLLDLICKLIEQPRSRIGGSILEPHGSAADCLIEIGLLRPGTVPSTIACRACDEDHAATPEFDSVARRYFHFCPVAGRVEVDPRDLGIFEIRARAMVDLLVAAFPVLPAVGRELVPRTAWHLGEAIVGQTSLTGFQRAGQSCRDSTGNRNRADRNEQPAARFEVSPAKPLHGRQSPRHC